MGLLKLSPVKIGVLLLSAVICVKGQCSQHPYHKPCPEGDNGECSKNPEPQPCPAGLVDLWEDKMRGGQGKKQRNCCDPNHPDYHVYANIADDCRQTDCIKTSACSPCDTLPPRWIREEKLEYEEILREPCTTRGGQHGLIGLCCAKNSTKSRLATTEGTEPHEFPHQARLRLGPGNCGGTIYNKRFILTAAHCVVSVATGELIDIPEMKVLLGTNMGDNEGAEYLYRVQNVIAHPEYSRWSTAEEFQKQAQGIVPRTWNDVALMELDREIQFGPNVKSLEIAPKGFDPMKYSDKAVSVGWGKNEDMEQSLHMHKVNMKLHSDEDCITGNGVRAPSYPEMAGFENVLLCAGGIVDGKWGSVTRSGDSGGPAICKGADGKPVQCGIVSMGGYDKKCIDLQDEANCLPAAFAEVSSFHDWITQNAGPQDPSTFYKPYLYGEAVPRGKYAHQVHITSENGPSCGGTLVAQNVVLTAAQCLLNGDMQHTYADAKVTTGINDLNQKGQTFNVAGQPTIPVYGFRRVGAPVDIAKQGKHVIRTDDFFENNLILIVLSGKANISPSQIPQLPPDFYTPEFGTELSFSRDKSVTSNLMARDYRFLDTAECQRRWDKLSNLGMKIEVDNYQDMFCGVEKYSGGSTCDRELGGGVICKGDDGKDILCGVQAYRLCDYTLPNGFINVEHHKSWINQVVKMFNK